MTNIPVHPTLQKIADLRASLQGTDFPEQIKEVEELDKKARKGLAVLSLKNNVGVSILLEDAIRERDDIEDWLLDLKPTSLDPQYCVTFVGEVIERQHMRKLWTWFIDMFAESEKDMADVEEMIKSQEEDPNDPDE